MYFICFINLQIIYFVFIFRSKKNWQKVGEGVYGEVFIYKAERNYRVIKIIPIEGKTCINSERQKRMSEVYSEILIAKELNNLCNKNNWNKTNAFCKVESISCVQGKYPENLIKLWKEYDVLKGKCNYYFFFFNRLL